MNVVLSDVILTSHNGSRFFQLSECYIRGGTIKCMRLSKEVNTLDNVPQEELNSKYNKARVGARKGIFGEKRGGSSGRGGASRGNGRGRGRGKGRS
ncbi:putative u6 snRNA-associated sm-like protein [Blastocystis sp. subtype 4]|uniref:putative u6 snRNA-associated sm-like protein n=1 Tax=Blastocystis sp. subtype 4 TaxID=944170 RepID=UPI000711A334|nr:putative u6 snRNA-associated sm-like protein [Blastocystis sp. subtype 4]KNB43368.1 putative u6 snRNA-associated sm-like protein [Blastocystis sp. subtype 4]|eukprot:XP_014526811.1 putative u6 snRNA-associated sm-like protein [Blastocystis sp. subtype 4]